MGSIKNITPNICLKVIGEGEKTYTQHLKNLSKKLNIERNIIFFGKQNSKDIAKELMMSEIFVLPTLVDNSPNSLAEAMAVGTPSIASNVGGIPTMIKNNYNGLLFEVNSVEHLSEEILRLLQNKELEEKISLNAKKTAYLRNKAELVAEQIIKVYQSIILNHNDI